MGCTTSSGRVGSVNPHNSSQDRESERSSSLASDNHPNNQNRNKHGATSIQDEARSFRSKTGAIKMLARNELSFNAFLQYLQEKNKSEFLICYRDMEEIKSLDEDQMISRTAALIWRYKTIFETMKANCAAAVSLGNNMSGSGHHHHQTVVIDPTCIEYMVWECFGKLRYMDVANAPAEIILKYLLITQNEILARLVVPFEGYLQSPQYKKWQEQLVEAEKLRRQQHQQAVAAANAAAAQNLSSVKSVTSIGSVSRLETCSLAYPHILVVDDSNVTLKITGLTLERDGHHVDRAHNGQIALEMMKSRSYDVVLIDCNMPVMDGFEAVQLFREYERSAKIDGILFEGDDEEDNDEDEGKEGVLAVREALDKFPGGEEDDINDLSSISDSDDEVDLRSNTRYLREKEKQEKKQRVLLLKLKRKEEKMKEKERLKQLEEEEKQQQKEKGTPTEDCEGGKKVGSGDVADKDTARIHANSNDGNSEAMKSGIIDEQTPSARTQVMTSTAASTSFADAQVSQSSGQSQPPTTANGTTGQAPSKFARMRTQLTREHYHQLIIGMSTMVDEDTKMRALGAGMDYFLPKPFTLEKFIETIRLSREDNVGGNNNGGGSVSSHKGRITSSKHSYRSVGGGGGSNLTTAPGTATTVGTSNSMRRNSDTNTNPNTNTWRSTTTANASSTSVSNVQPQLGQTPSQSPSQGQKQFVPQSSMQHQQQSQQSTVSPRTPTNGQRGQIVLPMATAELLANTPDKPPQ